MIEAVKEDAQAESSEKEGHRKSVTSVPMELLWAALCMAVLAAMAVTLLSDGKTRFKFQLEPEVKATPAPVQTPAPQTTPTAVQASVPPIVPPINVEATGGIQSLFVEEQAGRAENRTFAPSPFVNDQDFAQPRDYQDLKEQDLGKIYAAASKADKRALGKVARLGGFRSTEAMAVSFGYDSVDQMLAAWEQTIVVNPQFQPQFFGTNATPLVPNLD